MYADKCTHMLAVYKICMSILILHVFINMVYVYRRLCGDVRVCA